MDKRQQECMKKYQTFQIVFWIVISIVALGILWCCLIRPCLELRAKKKETAILQAALEKAYD